MSYFKYLPTLTYEFSSGSYNVPDLFTRVGFNENFFKNEMLYYVEAEDNIQKPERLSFAKYETFDHYWLLMLANKVYDVNKDWPQLQEDFGSNLDKAKQKKVYYLYEQAEIIPNDILFIDDFTYGVIESWNPYDRSVVLKESYNLPTTGVLNSTCEIKRIYADGTIENIENYCTASTVFTMFGYKPYTESPHQLIGTSGQILNSFLKVTSGSLTTSLLLDTCDTTDKTEFESSLIYKIVNGESVSGVRIKTQEDKMIEDYYDRIKLNIINPQYVAIFEERARLMFNDRNVKANTMFRAG